MNSKVYCNDILPVMIEEVRKQFRGDFLIIHDNARFAYSENDTKKYLAENDLEKYFLTIRPYSPDLNIIEVAWAILKQRVRKHCFVHGQTKNRNDFIDLISYIWSDISVETIEKLYNSLPSRMREVLRSDGKLNIKSSKFQFARE